MSSRRHPDKWIVPGGGMEPEEEPNVAAVREVCEEVCVLELYLNLWFSGVDQKQPHIVPFKC